MDLQFEWDETKAQANVRKHGISFNAALAFVSSVAGKRLLLNGGSMSDKRSEQAENSDDMAAEYDFSNGVRAKFYEAYQSGYQVTIHKMDGTTEVRDSALPEGAVVLDPDIRAYFPDSEAVNRTLRGLLTLMPRTSTPGGKAS